jgi:hypothetical protein
MDTTSSANALHDLESTRMAWHRVAEHVLAAARYAASGRIGLRPSPTGVRTPPFGPDGRVIEIDCTDLVLTAAGTSHRSPITTLRAAGLFVGIEPGAPAGVYTPATPLALDEPLAVDPAAARVLAGWFSLGEHALQAFSSEIADEAPSEAQLWPEHFDLGITAAAVNYGASPGDSLRGGPYLYVGPHAGAPADASGFWNAPFGAALDMHDVGSADEAVAFFRTGHDLVHVTSSKIPETRRR